MSEKRNVVLVTYDSLRADHCGYMGYERDTTPNLDAMAEEGIAVRNAIAPASRTNPSMAAILTGEPMVVRDRVANPENSRHHLERHGTIAEELSARGYATGAFNPNAYASRYYGFDRGFDRFEDFMFSSDQYQTLFDRHLSDSSIYSTLRNLRNFVRREEAFRTWDSYIDGIEAWVRGQTEPFFLWVFSLDTHFPHLTPRRHREWSSLFDQYYYNWLCNKLIDSFDIELSARQYQKIVDIYDDSIRFGDVLLGELQERLGAFDPVYVVHSDHGEAFGERGTYGHFYPALYEENIHVPLVVSGVDRSADVTKPTPLTDLPDVIHQASDGAVTYDGRAWATATDYDGRFERNLTAVRSRDWKYLVATSDDGQQHQLLDVTDGETEVHDEPPVEDVLARLNERRIAHEREQLRIRDVASDRAARRA